MARVLLLIPSHFYRTREFLSAGRRLGLEVTVACDRPQVLDGASHGGIVTFDFREPDKLSRQIVAFAGMYPLAAVIGVDDRTAWLAALASQALGLAHNKPAGVQAATDKFRFRQALQAAGLRTPSFRLLGLTADLAEAAESISYPCVLKPLHLSGSRGVIRADDPAMLIRAFHRIARLLEETEPAVAERAILVEEYVPGPEVALEGLIQAGELEVLAIFDKPDPLTGPVFEETLYITPSRLPPETQQRAVDTAQAAARALSLTAGPVHAELRLTPEPVMIELAPRAIGGLCAHAIALATGISIEESIIATALGQCLPTIPRSPTPAGVMMIPIPRAGILRAVHGRKTARGLAGIEDITLTISIGERLMPLPEGARYLGFIFARGGTPQAVECALRTSHQCLTFEIDER